jgi:peptidoglycan/LPS O-acetylase OafA/YrhL
MSAKMADAPRSSSRRIIRLEACRGIAAIVVVALHTVQAFSPNTRIALSDSVFYVLINGTAAVAFFFVLSGYVLTANFFASAAPNYMAAATIKRLPRLALLTTIATITSSLLWSFGLYRFNEAGHISGSKWLTSFGEAAGEGAQLGLMGAIKEGAWRTFLAGNAQYDSSLWTMVHEFHGSLLVFAMAPFIVFVFARRFVWLVLLSSAAIFHYADNYMLFFIAGMTIAYYEPQLRKIASPWLTFGLLATAIWPLSYGVQPDQPLSTLMIYGWLLGASFLVIAILCSSAAERIFDNRIGWLLGFISFPVYVIHVPIICSAGSAVFIATNGGVMSAVLCTATLTFIIALPLAFIDKAWVRSMNSFVAARFSWPSPA